MRVTVFVFTVLVGGLAVLIAVTNEVQEMPNCDLLGAVRVMKMVEPFLEHSDDMLFSNPVQRSIPDRLRDKADLLQRQDEAVSEFREMLRSCRGAERK